MKPLIPFLIIGVLISCSKGTEQTTDTSSENTGAGRGPSLSLSPAEAERVNFEIFLKLHFEQLYDGDPEVMAFKEEFTTNDNQFTYLLIRHNGSKAGWHSMNDEESGPYGETEPYGESEFEEEFTNEMDTIEIKGSYLAFAADGPESHLKTVRLAIRGKFKHTNVPYETYGEIKTYPLESDLDTEMLVELSAPRPLNPEHIYLKAKIADLAEQDLSGLNKEELGYIRNEIFARHGHTFKTDRMISYFSEKDWYHSVVDDATALLNKFEKRNVDFIKKMEG